MDKLEEKTEYENFVNKKEESVTPASLASFLGEDEEEVYVEMWKKHWQGMPEFEQEENKPYKEIKVRFRNEEDYLDFAKAIQQPLTKKTKSIWYPKLEKQNLSILAWMTEE